MVKQRMTALDVRATVEEMRANLIGLRLLNLYNISNKMFLFKFGQGENKRSVLLENGVRFHLTELAREKPKVPSQFTLKLRKHIRAWRLDSITQLQHDRTIDMCFGIASTEGCFHIIVELFSKGNVILTDHAYTMMMLLRTHRDEEGLNLVVRETYPVSAPSAGAPGGSVVSAAAEEQPHVMLYTPQVDASGHLHVHRPTEAELSPAQRLLKQERTRELKAEWDLGLSRSNDRTLLQALVAGIRHFGPDLAQHALTISGLPNTQQRSWEGPTDALFAKLVEGLLEIYDLAKVDLTTAGGYLIRKATQASTTGAAAATADAPPAAATASSSAAATVAVAEQYDSFIPILLAQYTHGAAVETIYRPSFGKVCDDFFLITETERIDASNDKRKNVAKDKEAKGAQAHARRITALEEEIAKNDEKGEQLILNAERVDEAIQLINGALATGLSWDALRSLLKRRNAEGHPVAYMIHDLFLERNAISVLLEAVLEDEEDDCDVPPLVVEVSLSKTAHANAADYFGKRKQHASKLERTVAATDKAAAGAARKGAQKAAERKEKKVIVKERQRNWWEKFFWFRTSAGDLVLRGKDVQSTELLLRRVKRLGDVFVQCEVDGSLPCLLRPMAGLWSAGGGGSTAAAIPEAAQPVASASLCEAGAWCVALSGAWESKQTTGAWWIYASQVTGGSAAGMYIFSGERHYLPPQPMSLGCGLLFHVTRTVDHAAVAVAVTGEEQQQQTGGGGDEHEGEEEEEHAIPDVAVEGGEEVLRRELPRLPTAAQLKAAATDATDVDTAATDVIPADPATALAAMASIESLRADQRRQQKTYSSSSGGGGSGGAKGRKGGYARNSRVDRSAVEGGRAGGVSVLSATDVESQAATAPATASAPTPPPSAPQPPQGGGGVGKALSKHQKKKLKKIQDKYGDQDDDDRALGAQVNGNQLSRVQLLELEQQAARRQQEEEEKRRQEKAARAAERAAGTLRYKSVGSGDATNETSEDEEGDEDVEVVSDFTDEEGEEEMTTRAGRAGPAVASPPPPAVTDDLAGDSEKEEATTPAASPTDSHPSGAHRADNSSSSDEGEDEEEGDSASQLRGRAASTITTTTTTTTAAAASQRDHEAAAALQMVELHRAFPHYTMRPAPTDVVQHVVAVCAPMMVVSDYAFHTSFAMGNAKKGVLAGKLLQVFTERAQKGGGSAGGAGGRKNAKKAARGLADPTAAGGKDGAAATASAAAAAATAAVAGNASVVTALQMMSPNDIVEQLRANVKPVEFKM